MTLSTAIGNQFTLAQQFAEVLIDFDISSGTSRGYPVTVKYERTLEGAAPELLTTTTPSAFIRGVTQTSRAPAAPRTRAAVAPTRAHSARVQELAHIVDTTNHVAVRTQISTLLNLRALPTARVATFGARLFGNTPQGTRYVRLDHFVRQQATRPLGQGVRSSGLVTVQPGYPVDRPFGMVNGTRLGGDVLVTTATAHTHWIAPGGKMSYPSESTGQFYLSVAKGKNREVLTALSTIYMDLQSKEVQHKLHRSSNDRVWFGFIEDGDYVIVNFDADGNHFAEKWIVDQLAALTKTQPDLFQQTDDFPPLSSPVSSSTAEIQFLRFAAVPTRPQTSFRRLVLDAINQATRELQELGRQVVSETEIIDTVLDVLRRNGHDTRNPAFFANHPDAFPFLRVAVTVPPTPAHTPRRKREHPKAERKKAA